MTRLHYRQSHLQGLLVGSRRAKLNGLVRSRVPPGCWQSLLAWNQRRRDVLILQWRPELIKRSAPRPREGGRGRSFGPPQGVGVSEALERPPYV